MKIFDAILLIGIIIMITLGAVFSESMFRNVSLEAGNGTSINETSTITSYGTTYAWIYVIAILLIIAALIIAFKLLQGEGL